MIKVKEFTEDIGSSTRKAVTVETQINDFLKNKQLTLIDIKYQVVSNRVIDYANALLIYKEDK